MTAAVPLSSRADNTDYSPTSITPVAKQRDSRLPAVSIVLGVQSIK